MGIFKSLKNSYIHKDNKTFIKYLRYKGIKIGHNCIFRSPETTIIDKTRPELIEIGNYVDMNRYFTIMTHDYTSSVFIRKYNDFINSSGKVTIGNNIYFGIHCTVLKGVTIGDNCIIGACSLVNKNIPANSVAAGVPAKVICTLDEYYAKRKEKAVSEALELARIIQEKHHRRPVISDFSEEFIYFIRGDEEDNAPVPAAKQLREAYPFWKKNHVPLFKDFDEFLHEAGIQ